MSVTGRERFKNAIGGEPVDATPVWFMRQAGRFLPEYRKVREKYDFITSCERAELIVEITLQPVKRLDVDAGIVFSDILLPLKYAGFQFHIADGTGPVIEEPIRSAKDVDKFRDFQPEESMKFLKDALISLRGELGDEKALIGFGGAPFTLASYLIEGGHSKYHILTKKFMHQHRDAWEKLMANLSFLLRKTIEFQASCGIDAFQVFDSWAGSLSPIDYKRHVLPFLKEALRDSPCPIIYFSTGTSGFLEFVKEAGSKVIGVDWRVSIDEAWRRVGYDYSIQGNLDPAVLLSSPEAIKRHVEDIIKRVSGRPGHIFNLGHGILPETPVENVQYTVELVRQLTSHNAG